MILCHPEFEASASVDARRFRSFWIGHQPFSVPTLSGHCVSLGKRRAKEKWSLKFVSLPDPPQSVELNYKDQVARHTDQTVQTDTIADTPDRQENCLKFALPHYSAAILPFCVCGRTREYGAHAYGAVSYKAANHER